MQSVSFCIRSRAWECVGLGWRVAAIRSFNVKLVVEILDAESHQTERLQRSAELLGRTCSSVASTMSGEERKPLRSLGDGLVGGLSWCECVEEEVSFSGYQGEKSSVHSSLESVKNLSLCTWSLNSLSLESVGLFRIPCVVERLCAHVQGAALLTLDGLFFSHRWCSARWGLYVRIRILSVEGVELNNFTVREIHVSLNVADVALKLL